MKTKKFKCPYCGTEYEMDWTHCGQTISLFGRKVRCATCRKEFIVGQITSSHIVDNTEEQKGDSVKNQEIPKIDEDNYDPMIVFRSFGKALIPETFIMRLIAGAFLLLIVAPWSYGFIGAFFDSGNTPLITVLTTIQSMNPITRHGYMFYFKIFTLRQQMDGTKKRLNETRQRLDEIRQQELNEINKYEKW